MSADIFIKKLKILLILGMASICCVFFSCVYAFQISRVQILPIDKTFYFLVSNSQYTQASAYEMELQGGAGYLLEYKGKNYAVMSLYFSNNIAQTVSASLQEKALLVCSVERLYFLNVEEKTQSQTVAYGLHGLYSCMVSLDKEITRLENGATQQSCARVLEAISTKLITFATACENALQGYIQEVIAIFERLRGLAGGVIYAKDLRYEMCALGDLYLKICNVYTL